MYSAASAAFSAHVPDMSGSLQVHYTTGVTTNSGGGFVYTTAVEHFAIAYQHYVLLVWGLVCQTPYQSTETPWRYTRSHRHTKGLWCCAWYTRRHVESGIHAEALLDGIPGQCVCTCTSCRGFGAFMHVFRIEHTHTHTTCHRSLRK